MGEDGEIELDVVAVGAHPDDVEIACGGTLARLAQLGYKVGIVDLTDGEPTPLSPGPDVRLEEARRAAEALGVHLRVNLNLPNRRLFDSFESRVALAKVFRKHRPKLVIGFGGKTVLASPDHYQAMLITDAAVFYSRLTKWDEHFDGLPVHTITNQLGFPISLHSLDMPESSGVIIADIGETLAAKVEAIKCYATQFPAKKAGIFSAIETMNRYHGLTAGFEAGRTLPDLPLRRRRRLDAMGLPRPDTNMSHPGGPMRPTNNQARPPGPAETQAEAPPSEAASGPVEFEATMPETVPMPAHLVEKSAQPTWRGRLRGLWQSLAGSRKEPAMTQDRDLPAEPAPVSASRARTLRVGVVSTVGNYREHNEDNFYLPTLAGKAMGGGIGHRDASMEIPIEEGPIYTFVVADGMGGQLAGEKASQMAVEIIPKELLKRIDTGDSDDRQVQRVIRDAVAAANQEILSLSSVQTEFSNMGTTVVLALFRNDRVYFAGIGDSRAYRCRDGRIEQLTKDHSLAQALLEAGTITAEELPNHKFNHVLYLYLGSKDARGGPEDVKAAEFRAGDRFLLASDGLTGVVPDSQLGEVVWASDDPQASARTLIKLALDNNSKDNVTCLVVHAV